jgi:hypothetical protein
MTATQASAGDGPTVVISGFGTAALTMSDSDQAEYVRNNQASGAMKDARTGVDSNFGVQATAKVNDWLSFTAQGLVRKHATDNFGAELAWAFAKAKVNDDFNVRVGRLGLPVYMVSDYLNVGYANTMIRPPIEVYRQVSIDYVDGADVVYQHSFNDTTITAQFAAGTSVSANVGGSIGKFNPLTALNVLAENGPFTFRFGRADTKFTASNFPALDGLVATLRKVGFNTEADQIQILDTRGSFTSVGMSVDWNNIIVQTEYAQRRTTARTVMDTNSWYTMLGYRMGKFTPYYNHATVAQQSPRSFDEMPVTGPLAGLTAAANSVIKTGLQTTDTFGLRWDFAKSAALKVQVDRVAPRDGPGSFAKPQPGFTGPVTVYAAGIDFVF